MTGLQEGTPVIAAAADKACEVIGRLRSAAYRMS
jgi:sugar (pentulose or hexulose) kinase